MIQSSPTSKKWLIRQECHIRTLSTTIFWIASRITKRWRFPFPIKGWLGFDFKRAVRHVGAASFAKISLLYEVNIIKASKCLYLWFNLILMEHVSIVVMILILRVIPIQFIHNLYIPRVKDTKKVYSTVVTRHIQDLWILIWWFIFTFPKVSPIYMKNILKAFLLLT